jgi:hypothetical protein
MGYILLIAFVLLLIFGWAVAIGFVQLVVVGAVWLLGIVSAYLVFEGIKKKEWGSAFCWFIVLVVWLKVLF